jgi:hypothetical protein
VPILKQQQNFQFPFINNNFNQALMAGPPLSLPLVQHSSAALFPTMVPSDIQQQQPLPLPPPPQSAPLVSYQFQEPLNSFEFANLNMGQVIGGEGGGEEVDIAGEYNFF